MESNIIIAVIIGLVIGVIITFLLKSKSTQKHTESNPIPDHSRQELEVFESTIKSLEDERALLQKKLSESENILKIVQESSEANTDLSKLIKEIKKLKDEIDDLEDNLETQERNNKKLRLEKTEAEENIDVIEREKRNLTTEKEELLEKLALKTKESEEDNKSLTFINNILNAKNAVNKDMEEIDHKTWNIYSYIVNSVNPYFTSYTEEKVNLDDSAWDWRNTEMKTWIKNKKVVAIVGEFSAGKTSIVNRILSQDDPNAVLLPTSSKETTAVPTYISKSKDFNCQFYSPDGDLRNIKKETFEMVTKSVLDKVNVSHLTKYFVLSYDNKHLDNISILDTPGFGSNSEEIIKKTTDVVKEAHVLFWVIDANTGDINQTSIDVMKNHLNEVPLYFIINKSDTKSARDLEQLEKKIQTTAQNNNIQYQDIIRFSQKEDVEVLMKHIKEIPIQEQPPLMRHILDRLDFWIQKLGTEKKEFYNDRKQNIENINVTEGNFTLIKDEVGYSVDTIKRLVKEKETWFGLGENKYQIDPQDYQDFVQSTESIIELSSQINKQVEYYSKTIKDKIDIDNKIKENKYQLAELDKVKKEFIKLITDYNENLLN